MSGELEYFSQNHVERYQKKKKSFNSIIVELKPRGKIYTVHSLFLWQLMKFVYLTSRFTTCGWNNTGHIEIKKIKIIMIDRKL